MKNNALRVINFIALLVLAFGACSLDSDSVKVPLIMMLSGGGWLLLFYFVNAKILEEWYS